MSAYGAVTRIARQLGVAPESLRKWVIQAEIDGGTRPGVTTEDEARIQELEREMKERRRANEILKSCDRPRQVSGRYVRLTVTPRSASWTLIDEAEVRQ